MFSSFSEDKFCYSKRLRELFDIHSVRTSSNPMLSRYLLRSTVRTPLYNPWNLKAAAAQGPTFTKFTPQVNAT